MLPISPPYLPHISPISPLYLPYIATVSPPYLRYISPDQIVYRDLKPENLLLDAQVRVRVRLWLGLLLQVAHLLLAPQP